MPDKFRMTPDDRDLVIRTIIGEAADQPEEGQAAVAHVIMNRLRSGRHGSTPSDVVLARGQFEPWQTRARELMSVSPKSRQYQRTGDLFDRVINGDYDDPTNGATHFLDEAIVRRRRGGSLPSWASGNGQRIGDHTFYAPEGRALGYAPEDATNVAGPPGERTAARASRGGPRLAQAGKITPEDIAETLRQAGLSTAATAPAETGLAAGAPSQQDIEETLRQAGVTMSRTSEPTPKNPVVTEPPPGKLGPQAQEMAEQYASRKGPVSAIAEGVPIFGPALGRGLPAATGALFPSTGSMPGESVMERFTGNKQVMDEASRLYQERHPYMSLAGDFLGSTALTGAGALSWPSRLMMGMEGPSIASKIYTGVMGGSGINALDAALRGENVPNAAMVGAGGSAAGPLVSAGISGLGRGVARNIPVLSGPLAGLNSVARDRLTGVLEGETAGSITASRQRMGPAGFFGDLNTAATDIAGGIADTPGPGKALVRGAYQARDAGQRGRVDDAITRATGMPHANIEDFKRFTTEARAAAADPLYQQWRSMQVDPTDKLLNNIMPRLEKAGAFHMAEGLADVSGHDMNRAAFSKAGNPTNYPTTETWDYVKRGVDRLIDRAFRDGDKTLARELINLKHDLINEIGNTPAGKVWKQARHEFASKSAILDQIEAGKDTFLGGRSGLSPDELQEELRGLSGPEISARLQGLRAAVDQVMGDTMRGDTTLRNKILADNNQKKMRLLLGHDKAEELINTMKQEKFFKDQSQNVIGGSQTTPKKERVDALKAPAIPHWAPNLTAPFTWVPPSATPTGIMGAWRGQRYGDAVNQLAPIMATPNDTSLDRLLDALSKEGRRRSKIENRVNISGNLLGALTSGPLTATSRRHYFPTE